jgi:glycosyltransferase involved in cell wall biosynthesis
MEILKKKILLLSTGDVNGAYEAIYKLANLFIGEGHTVCMFVKNKTKNEKFIVQYFQAKKRHSIVVRVLHKIKNKLKHILDQKPKPIHFDAKYSFISKDETKENIVAENVISQIGFVPDFIITGMTDGFINSTDLLNLQKITQAKIYNITVDMNHFTGGCHYAWDCEGYIKGCDEKCPAIIGENNRGLAKINFETKFKNAQEGKFQIISGSGWTLKQAKESKIYKDQNGFYNINSLIDTKLFNAQNKDIAKRVFDFDSSKFYILAGCQNANDPRKGFSYFVEALKNLETQLSEEQKDKVVIVVVSHNFPEEFELLKFKKQKINYITDYRLLVVLYQAIDLFINSSIEDAGPMMVSEALACGTPVVGFDMGVVNNMVINQFNGYKAILKDSNDLAQGIEEILKLSKEEYNQYSVNAVKQVEEYSSFQYATKVFNEIFA